MRQDKSERSRDRQQKKYAEGGGRSTQEAREREGQDSQGERQMKRRRMNVLESVQEEKVGDTADAPGRDDDFANETATATNDNEQAKDEHDTNANNNNNKFAATTKHTINKTTTKILTTTTTT